MSQTQLKASVVIDLAGNLQQRARQYENSVNSFSRSGARSLSLIRSSANLTGRALDQVGNRFIAFATGGVVVAAGKQITDFSARLNQLGIDAGLNGDALKKFKENTKRDIAEYAKIWGVNRDEIIASMEDIVQKTGDLDYANKVLQTNAKIIRATNSAGGDIGRVAAEFQKMGLSPDKANEAWDILLKQGKFGAFTVRDMASLSPRIFAARPMRNLNEVRETGAMMQTLMMSAGSPEQATTSFEALMRELNNPETLKRLKKARISVMKKGTHDLLPLPEIVNNIVTGTKGDRVKLAGIIRAEEATRGLTRLLDEYKRTGKTQSFNDLLKIEGDGSQLIRDANDNLREAKYQLTRMVEAGKEFADLKLAGPIDELAAAINGLPTDKLESIVSKLMLGGAVVGGAGTAWLGSKWIGKIFGSKGAATPVANAASTATRIISPDPISVQKYAGAKAPWLTRFVGGPLAALNAGGIALGALKMKYDQVAELAHRARDPVYGKSARDADRTRMIDLLGTDAARKSKIEIEITGDAASRARVTNRDKDIDVISSGAVMGTR